MQEYAESKLVLYFFFLFNRCEVLSAHRVTVGRMMQLLEELFLVRSQDGYRGSVFEFLLEVFMTV